MEPIVRTVRLVRTDRGLVAVVDGPVQPLTVEAVREALEDAHPPHRRA